MPEHYSQRTTGLFLEDTSLYEHLDRCLYPHSSPSQPFCDLINKRGYITHHHLRLTITITSPSHLYSLHSVQLWYPSQNTTFSPSCYEYYTLTHTSDPSLQFTSPSLSFIPPSFRPFPPPPLLLYLSMYRKKSENVGNTRRFLFLRLVSLFHELNLNLT